MCYVNVSLDVICDTTRYFQCKSQKSVCVDSCSVLGIFSFSFRRARTFMANRQKLMKYIPRNIPISWQYKIGTGHTSNNSDSLSDQRTFSSSTYSRKIIDTRFRLSPFRSLSSAFISKNCTLKNALAVEWSKISSTQFSIGTVHRTTAISQSTGVHLFSFMLHRREEGERYSISHRIYEG